MVRMDLDRNQKLLCHRMGNSGMCVVCSSESNHPGGLVEYVNEVLLNYDEYSGVFVKANSTMKAVIWWNSVTTKTEE